MLLIGLLVGQAQLGLAQTGGRIVLQTPDVSQFPGVSLTFEAYDSKGAFLSDLAQAEVKLTENDQPVAVQSLSQIQPGMHIIMAFNAAPTLGTAVGSGPNRFDLIKRNLLNWMQTQPGNTLDEFSLVTNAGPQATRLSGPAQWAAALTAYTPDLPKTQSSLASLTTALDLASDPSRRSNSKRAILYVTAPLPDANLAALANLADRAGQLGVRIAVWLVPPAGSDNHSNKPLSDLATRTGGQFLVFNGPEYLPSPEIYFQPLRFLYRVSYTSGIRQAGAQRVALAVQRSDLSAQAEQRFNLELQPPNLFFLAPPVTVQRSWSPADAAGVAALTPAQVELRTIVEFHDGFRRAPKVSRLFVDGRQVSEVTSEPFSPLIWPLEAYNISGRHLLRVEIEDSLGLKRSTIEVPVELQVEPAPVFDLSRFLAGARAYLPVAGAVAGGVLALIVGLVGLRVLRQRLANWRSAPIAARGGPRPRADVPVPVPAHFFVNSNAPARLVHVTEGPFTLPAAVIALQETEVRLGSDPQQVDCLLESLTVDGLHARINRLLNGRYIITDISSAAGTWVNYTLVSPQGTPLEHGDLVQFGREAFRFELKNPPPPRSLKVTSIQEDA